MKRVSILTKKQRYQVGKSLRQKCPGLSHGKETSWAGRPVRCVALIEDSKKDRLENLIPVRHGRMLQSVFAFFRGTAALQAYDFAGSPTSSGL